MLTIIIALKTNKIRLSPPHSSDALFFVYGARLISVQFLFPDRFGPQKEPGHFRAHAHLLVFEHLMALGHLRHHVVEDLQLAPGEDQIEGFPDADHHHQHEREQDGRGAERLDQPQADQAGQLDQREEVHLFDWNLNHQKNYYVIKNSNE